jgi:hypothetical protein
VEWLRLSMNGIKRYCKRNVERQVVEITYEVLSRVYGCMNNNNGVLIG